MKTITIGRDDDCDIIVNDSKGLVSRRHAILKENSLGNYVIIDVSKNGTFINGLRIKPHTPCKVGRRDVVVFSNSAKLDWTEIPDRYKFIRVGMIGLICVIALSLVFIFVDRGTQNDIYNKEVSPCQQKIMIDSTDESNSGSVESSVVKPSSNNKSDSTTDIPEIQSERKYKEADKTNKKEDRIDEKKTEYNEVSEEIVSEEESVDKNPGGD